MKIESRCGRCDNNNVHTTHYTLTWITNDNIYCARNYTCKHTHMHAYMYKKKGMNFKWVHSHLMEHNITRAYMDFDRAILFRINYLISQEIKVNIIYPVKSLCVFWLSSCSIWWQATLETNYHAVVAHKTSVWIQVCVYVCYNIKFCCDA